MGLTWACECEPDMKPKLISAVSEAGLLMNPIRPNAIRLMPVLTITEDEIDQALVRLATGLTNATK
mgnify:CR=1 FL=1